MFARVQQLAQTCSEHEFSRQDTDTHTHKLIKQKIPLATITGFPQRLHLPTPSDRAVCQQQFAADPF